MFYTIYQIRNKIDNKIYIGKHQTTDLDDNYMGSGKHLKRAQEKYGLDQFEKTILYMFDNENEMNAKEVELVNEEFCAREDTYNISLGGIGGSRYRSHDTKMKIRNSLIGKESSRKGAILTEETKKKLSIQSSLNLIGNTRRLGIKDSEETKIKKKKAFKESSTHAIAFKNVSSDERLRRSKHIKERYENGYQNPFSRKDVIEKISQSKTGCKRLYKDGEFKMAKPNSEKWNTLILDGWVG